MDQLMTASRVQKSRLGSASLGFSSAPIAWVCLLWCMAPEKLEGMNFCLSAWTTNALTIGMSLFVSISWLIAIAVLGGQCDDYNNDYKKSQELKGFDDDSIESSWSMVLMVIALVLSVVSTVFFWIFHCSWTDGHGLGPGAQA